MLEIVLSVPHTPTWRTDQLSNITPSYEEQEQGKKDNKKSKKKGKTSSNSSRSNGGGRSSSSSSNGSSNNSSNMSFSVTANNDSKRNLESLIKKTKLRGLSLPANYTDRVTAACRLS
jgi:hypothetical protein